MLSYFTSEKISATLFRPSSGSYSNGVWTPEFPSTSTVEIIAPQPLRADEIQMLPEGERVWNHLVTWMTPQVKVWPVVPGTTSDNPDLLLISGAFYKVMQVSNRSVLGNYYRVVIRETDYTPPDPPT